MGSRRAAQAAAWIQEDSCPEYLQKAEDCLRAEEERVNHYLHQSSKARLLEKVRLLSSSHRGISSRKSYLLQMERAWTAEVTPAGEGVQDKGR